MRPLPERVLAESGIELRPPGLIGEKLRHPERNELVMSVEQQQEIVVLHRAPPPIAALHACSEQIDTEAARVMQAPLLDGHLVPVLHEPDDLLQTLGGDRVALQEAPPAEHRMAPPQADHAGCELAETPLLLVEVPVEPGDGVVLAIGVV